MGNKPPKNQITIERKQKEDLYMILMGTNGQKKKYKRKFIIYKKKLGSGKISFPKGFDKTNFFFYY